MNDNDKEQQENRETKEEIIDIIPTNVFEEKPHEEKKEKKEKHNRDIFDNPNPTDEDFDSKPKKKLKERLAGRLGKAIIITAAIIAIIVIVILIILHLSSSKGIRTAKSISKYMGESVKTVEKKLDISIKKESTYEVLQNGVEFDYIYEDKDKTIKADGITFPTWAVFIKTNDQGDINYIRYTDFQIIKDNMRGEKKKAPISLDKFDKGSGMGSVEDEIDMEPYSVIYKVTGTQYVYKYHYTNDSGDDQGVILTVNYDKDDKYQDYESKLIYPDNL